MGSVAICVVRSFTTGDANITAPSFVHAHGPVCILHSRLSVRCRREILCGSLSAVTSRGRLWSRATDVRLILSIPPASRDVPTGLMTPKIGHRGWGSNPRREFSLASEFSECALAAQTPCLLIPGCLGIENVDAGPRVELGAFGHEPKMLPLHHPTQNLPLNSPLIPQLGARTSKAQAPNRCHLRSRQ